jgi:hypothetical protein
MRIIRTSIALAAALAITGTAFAASTTNSVTTTMRGTAHLSSGGTLTLTTIRRKPSSNRFHVTINFDVRVRSTTVLGFAAHPCRSTKCDHASLSTIKLGSGHRRVTFNGGVPIVRATSGGRTSRFACVFAQLRDRGPSGRAPGKIVRNGKAAGVTVCQNVGAGG